MSDDRIVEVGHLFWRIVDPNGQVRAGSERLRKSRQFTAVIPVILQGLLDSDCDNAIFLPVRGDTPQNVRPRKLTIVDAGVEGSFRFQHNGTTYHLLFQELARGSNCNRNIPETHPPINGRFEPVW